MIIVKGIHLISDDNDERELHWFARKITLSRSWFHFDSYPYYEVICPHKQDKAHELIERLAKKEKRKGDKLKVEIEGIFSSLLK